MTSSENRNALILLLWEHLGIPVIPADEVQPETEFPYAFYSVINPGGGLPGMGNVKQESRESEDPAFPTDVISVMQDMPVATFSLTFCSVTREEKFTQNQIIGDDEAMSLAQKARDYLVHGGYYQLDAAGLVTVDTTEPTRRGSLVVDSFDSRYGFDVRIRCAHDIERNEASIENLNYTRKES